MESENWSNTYDATHTLVHDTKIGHFIETFTVKVRKKLKKAQYLGGKWTCMFLVCI